MTELSVIIPVGDGREANLRLVLESLRMQTLQDFEVVICCDGASPLSEDLWKGLSVKYSWVPRQGKVNLGAVNRNRGARMAESDYLIFLDSDVLLNREALWAYAEDFWNFPRRAICGPYHWLPPMKIELEDVRERWEAIASKSLPILQKPPYPHNVHDDPRLVPWDKVSSDALWCDYRRAIMVLSGNMAVHRDVFTNVGGFWEELQYGIDGAFGLALYQAGYSWSFNGKAVGYHLHHDRAKGVDDGGESMKKIVARFHNDESWLGTLNKRVGWHWNSKNG